MIDAISDGDVPGMKKRRRARSAQVQPGDVDRLPPHAPESEAGTIGCCLISPRDCVGECAERIKGRQVFYDQRFQTMWNILLEMYDKQEAMDVITIQQRLRDRNLLDQLGGWEFLGKVQESVPSAANLPVYLEEVLKKFLLREMVAACTEAVAGAYEPAAEEAEKYVLAVEERLSKLTEAQANQTEEHIKSVMGRVITDMEQWHYSRGSQQIRGLPTGPPGVYLDKILMGIRETHFITVAGRPGDGKSSFAMNVVEYLAKDYEWYEPTGEKIVVNEVEVDETVKRKGIPVGVFTIEMDNESLGYRLIFGRAGVDEAQFNQGFAKKGDEAKLAKAAAELASTNIWLDDTPAQTIGQIAAKARRMARQHGIKLFVLDYLQLCTSDDPRDDDRKRLDKISKKIMALKKQLKVPWLVLAQMNRNIETAERDRPPMLSDLAGSGSIEQDSDKVIILKRPTRRELEKPHGANEELPSDQEILDLVCRDWEWSRRPSRVDAWVVKNRRGPRGKAEMIFQNNLCRFEDWHMWKVRHNAEDRKAGESKSIGQLPTNDELNIK
jgi:replicative DNA helicase